MGTATIIFIILAILSFTSGDIVTILIFCGLAALFFYLWATKDKRREDDLKQEQQKKALAARARHEERSYESLRRFSGSELAMQIANDCRANGWADLDHSRGGCQVQYQSIVTPRATYTLADMGYRRLTDDECELLAYYLGMQSGTNFAVEKITKAVGGYSNSYSGYIDSNSGVSITRDSCYGEVTVGYRVYDKKTVVQPPRRDP